MTNENMKRKKFIKIMMPHEYSRAYKLIRIMEYFGMGRQKSIIISKLLEDVASNPDMVDKYIGSHISSMMRNGLTIDDICDKLVDKSTKNTTNSREDKYEDRRPTESNESEKSSLKTIGINSIQYDDDIEGFV